MAFRSNPPKDQSALSHYKDVMARQSASRVISLLSIQQLRDLAIPALESAVRGKLEPLHTKLQVDEALSAYEHNARHIARRF